ncbi:3-methyladenine DNA glycosylase [Bdellovibrio bacteriovorus]|uniref:Putative 3-methyladenine DNA glycosylase n=1 Tax=Bdellovibrio bacteriovorus TaxID=959 RepID=A0A150WQA0_BDEBC|nr:DNA-3-methyladenine glycosylase [Bdellovibrio bacteriovorus]KYG66600.1 3-methyladenine DNA glycosylase [Bdellovibrio bacteriovorus]
MILPQEFYFQDTKTVAKALLGKILHLKIGDHEQKARIVETEAYLGVDDPACHTFGGKNTSRVQSMYLDGGHSYVYLIYGMYHCLNVVTRTTEFPEAVLIRGVQPLEAIPHLMKKKDYKTNGPGKLCKYYGITKDHDGLRLWKKNSDLFIGEDEHEVKKSMIVSSPRIGVDYAGEAANWPLRYHLKNNLFVSRP